MFNQQFLLKHFPIFGRSLHRAQASRFMGPMGPLADYAAESRSLWWPSTPRADEIAGILAGFA